MKIKTIKIKAPEIFHTDKLITWKLGGVNILSGGNGTGKSFILNNLNYLLGRGKYFTLDKQVEIFEVIFTNNKSVKYDKSKYEIGYLDQWKKNSYIKNTGISTNTDFSKIKVEEYKPEYHRFGNGEYALKTMKETCVEDHSNNEEFIYILYCPENFLHFDEGKKLIRNILTWNKNAQIILKTHSPAIIIDGWRECVVNIEDLINDSSKSSEGSVKNR